MQTKNETERYKITLALETIKSNSEMSQEEISEKLSEKNIKITSSELSRAKIDSRTPLNSKIKLQKIERALDKLLLDQFSFVYNSTSNSYEKTSKSFHSTEIIADKLQLYYNTHWALYYYQDSSSHARLRDGISKAILHVLNDGKVEIENPKLESATDYVGTIELHDNQNNLIFHLRTKDTKEKKFEINLIIGEGKVYSLAVGQYTNLDSKGAIVGGTVVLEQIDVKSAEQLLQPIFYEFGSQAYKQELNPNIRRFLSDKRMNFMRVTTGIYTNEQLGEFLEKNDVKKKYRNFIEDCEHDVFISSPMTSVNGDEYINFRTEILKVIDTLKTTCQFSDVYYAGNLLDTPEKFFLPNVTFRVNMMALEKSKYILLIYPKRIVSSVLIEIGWALKSNKPCIIFVRNRVDLPHILQQVGEIHDIANVSILEYNDTSDIIKIIENNGRKLFGEY